MNSLAWSIGRSILHSLGRKRLFVFPLTNGQLDLTKRKMSSNGSANVKHSEAMSDEIVTAMSTACGASIFLFELFKKKPTKHLLSWLRNERGLLASIGFNNMTADRLAQLVERRTTEREVSGSSPRPDQHSES